MQSYWKHWPCLFPQHGPGRKHERELGMAEWQRKIVTGTLRTSCVGCSTPTAPDAQLGQAHGRRRTKRYDYPRWQFVNYSADIRGWCCDALDLLEVPWRQSNCEDDLGVDACGCRPARRADRAEVLSGGLRARR